MKKKKYPRFFIEKIDKNSFQMIKEKGGLAYETYGKRRVKNIEVTCNEEWCESLVKKDVFLEVTEEELSLAYEGKS